MFLWFFCGIAGFAFSITLFSFVVGIRFPSLATASQLPVLVLGAFISAVLLKAVTARWLIPELRRCGPRRRIIWPGAIAALALILTVWTGTYFPGIIDKHSLEIVATGEKHPQARESEVWVKSIRYGNGKEVALRELSAAGQWTMEHNGYFASYQEQPATLKWQGMTDFLAVVFEINDIGGKALLRWDGQEEALDLFAVDPSNHLHFVGQTASLAGMGLKACQALALFTALLLFTSLFRPSQIAFREEAFSFTNGTARKAKEALSAPGVKGHRAALLAIIVWGVVFRLYYLNEPVRYDEAYTFLHFASKPLGDAASNYFVPNNHLLNTILIRLSYLLLGVAPWIIRLPAFAAGILLIPASYVMARLHYNKEIGLLASALVASFFPLMFHSVNARGYTIVCLCFVLLLSLATYLIRSNNWLAWLLFVLLSVAGFYTVPVFLLPFAAAWLWLLTGILLEPKSKPCRTKLLGYLAGASVLVGVGVVLVYTPVFLRSGIFSVTSNEFVSSRGFEYFLSRLPANITQTWNEWYTGASAVPLRYLMPLLLGLGLIFHRRISRYKVPVFAATVLVSLAVIFVQGVIPYIRVWVFLLPVYLLTVSAGGFWLYDRLRRLFRIEKTGAGWLWGALSLLVCLYISFNIWQTKSIDKPFETVLLPQADEVASLLLYSLEPGDNVVTNHQETLAFYFFMHDFPAPYWNGERMADSKRVVLVSDSREYSDTLRNVLSQQNLDFPDTNPAAWETLGVVGDVRVYVYKLK